MPRKYILAPATQKFEQQVHKLAKTYSHVRSDIDQALKDIVARNDLGQAIPGFNGRVWKKRCSCKETGGKRGGYRLFLFCQTDEVIPLAIIHKSQRSDLPSSLIRTVLLEAQESAKTLFESQDTD